MLFCVKRSLTAIPNGCGKTGNQVVGAPITRVKVTVEFLLRDSSGNIDDAFEGWVDVLVIANLV